MADASGRIYTFYNGVEMIKKKHKSSCHQLAILYTTVNKLEDAENLARQSIELKYAACVNIIPAIKSIYIWNENIEETIEYSMIFKTIPDALSVLEEWILKHHPYDLPSILKWNAESSADFFQYINESIFTVL